MSSSVDRLAGSPGHRLRCAEFDFGWSHSGHAIASSSALSLSSPPEWLGIHYRTMCHPIFSSFDMFVRQSTVLVQSFSLFKQMASIVVRRSLSLGYNLPGGIDSHGGQSSSRLWSTTRVPWVTLNEQQRYATCVPDEGRGAKGVGRREGVKESGQMVVRGWGDDEGGREIERERREGENISVGPAPQFIEGLLQDKAPVYLTDLILHIIYEPTVRRGSSHPITSGGNP
ncbi:hypothetical protein J6590_089511 [Homalodisca vitripennis]|nr:hypothetical protein J6590_089511 [Homalodisca vitripennis]